MATNHPVRAPRRAPPPVGRNLLERKLAERTRAVLQNAAKQSKGRGEMFRNAIGEGASIGGEQLEETTSGYAALPSPHTFPHTFPLSHHGELPAARAVPSDVRCGALPLPGLTT